MTKLGMQMLKMKEHSGFRSSFPLAPVIKISAA